MNSCLKNMIEGLTFTNFYLLLRNGFFGENILEFSDECDRIYTIKRYDNKFFTRINISESLPGCYCYGFYYIRPTKVFHNIKDL